MKELAQQIEDLEVYKRAKEAQLRAILDTNRISKRGTNRLLMALASYPREIDKKLTDSDEIAALTVLMEIKKAQMIMLALVGQLEETKASEVTEENKGE